VAWWAHVGGFVAGLVLMPLLSAVTRADDESADWFGDSDDEDDFGPSPRRSPPGRHPDRRDPWHDSRW
jgi:hypothetical protein